jgi:hypothetical protein
MGKLREIRRRVNEWGLRRAAHWEVMHALARVLGIRVHYIIVSSGSGRWGRMAPPVIPEGYRVHMVGLDDLLPFVGSAADFSERFLRDAFAGGDVCVASFHGSELVGCSFQSGGRSPVTDQLDILIPKGFRYTYKTWIHPAHRRRNLSQIQGYVRYHARGGQSNDRGIWYVETHNYPSLLHSYRHPRERDLVMGFIGWWSLFGRQVPFRTRAARWLGVELVRKDDTRPRLYVR